MALQTMIIMNVPSVMHLTIDGIKMKMWWNMWLLLQMEMMKL
jgi:hypothetical protein